VIDCPAGHDADAVVVMEIDLVRPGDLVRQVGVVLQLRDSRCAARRNNIAIVAAVGRGRVAIGVREDFAP
jgi:hypothetical protein